MVHCWESRPGVGIDLTRRYYSKYIENRLLFHMPRYFHVEDTIRQPASDDDGGDKMVDCLYSYPPLQHHCSSIAKPPQRDVEAMSSLYTKKRTSLLYFTM